MTEDGSPGTASAGTGPTGTGPAGTGPAGTGPAGTGPAESTALPRIGRPATRALEQIGVTTLEQVARRSEAELLALHGVGPRAVGILREALTDAGLPAMTTSG